VEKAPAPRTSSISEKHRIAHPLAPPCVRIVVTRFDQGNLIAGLS